MRKYLPLLVVGVFGLSFCSTSLQKKAPLLLSVPLEKEGEEFPKFNDQEVFIKSAGMQVTHFQKMSSDWNLKASSMFSCVDEKYFVKGTDYCFYFDKLLVSAKLSEENNGDVMSLRAGEAYANKILKDFLFHNTVLTIKNSDFVLFSSVLSWDKNRDFLTSPNHSKHTLKNTNGDVLTGENLNLSYKIHLLHMQKVHVNLREDI